MSTAPRLLAAAAAVTAGVVGVGSWVLGAAPGADDSRAAPDVTVAELDTAMLPVRRGTFCGAVADGSVARALGLPAGAAAPGVVSYDAGERALLTRGVRDVASEYSCSWRGRRTLARAWVFAPPVTPARARSLRGLAAEAEGCSRRAGAAAYGTASAALSCRGSGRREASYRGLFGDAWLTCSLSVDRPLPGRRLWRRADRWCAAVAVAAASEPRSEG